jgi:serine/threonine protein kinase
MTKKKYVPSYIRPGKISYIAPEVFAYQGFHGALADVWSLGVMFFILLAGYPPFTKPHLHDRCFQYLFNQDCSFLLGKWNLLDKIPSEARDLLNKIFVPAKKRISLREVLEHPWLEVDVDRLDSTPVEPLLYEQKLEMEKQQEKEKEKEKEKEQAKANDIVVMKSEEEKEEKHKEVEGKIEEEKKEIEGDEPEPEHEAEEKSSIPVESSEREEVEDLLFYSRSQSEVIEMSDGEHKEDVDQDGEQGRSRASTLEPICVGQSTCYSTTSSLSSDFHRW